MNKSQVIADIQARADFLLEIEEKPVTASGNITDYTYVIRDKRGQVSKQTARFFIKDLGGPNEEAIIDRGQMIPARFNSELDKFFSVQIQALDLDANTARFTGVIYNAGEDVYEERNYFAGRVNGNILVKELKSYLNTGI